MSASGWEGARILDDLRARGLVQDSTDLDALRERLARGPITVYGGFDPTADSLHLGHLLPLLALRRFQLHGHRAIVLAGGATGMIGDPSGRSEERQLLDGESLDRNVEAIGAQLVRFVEIDGSDSGVLVDNRTWTEQMSAIEFLRDVGKHVTVNVMLGKESVRARVAGEGGLSYTEFSYMLLQANDYLWLSRHEGCELQIGGSDQWGNITAGIDLVRRVDGVRVHGLTMPLITRADGAKFGKTAGGTVWLSAERTSPYDLYQYLVRTDDADVERLLLHLTLLPVEDVAALMARHRADPPERAAQHALAAAVTALVHGDEAAQEAATASDGFTRAVTAVDAEGMRLLAAQVGSTQVTAGQLDAGLDIVDVLVESGLATSKGAARRLIEGGGVYVNDVAQEGPRVLTVADLIHDRYVILRRGKKERRVLVVG